MNYLLVFKLQAVILAALTVAFGGSALLAATIDDPYGKYPTLNGFLLSALLTAAFAIGFYLLGRNSKNVIFRREALAVIGTAWLSASLIGALPYYLIIPELDFFSALFESTSGITTTGASVLSDLERLPPSLLFWRSISQWIGGLGIVVFFVAVLSFLGAGSKVLFSRESSADSTELDSARIQKGIFRLMYLYFGLTAACIGALYLAGMSLFDAINHGFTTLSTAGFSTRSGSIAAFNSPAIEWVMIVFMVIGGTSFIPMLRLLRGDWAAFSKSTEIKLFYAIILVTGTFTAIVLFLGDNYGTIEGSLRASLFQVVSLITTSGFSTENYDLWSPLIQIILVLLMICGGCSGSTAGGAKVIRLIVAGKIARLHIEKAYRAHVVRPLLANGQTIGRSSQEAVMVYFLTLGFTTVGGVLVVALLEPNLSLVGTVSTTISCLFNIGTGFAEIGPTETYASFKSITKGFLSLLMVLGRVELYAILVLFVPALWKRY
jgi:trk system potassium uptake protein TrkH|tara:strand:- start:1015 stop:2487 length:1473 start_codon:yes stop_codon:yes gene_type:complete